MTLDFYWRIDDQIYIGPYWLGTESQQTITYKFIKGGRGFEVYSDYFEELWNNCKEPPEIVKKNKDTYHTKKRDRFSGHRYTVSGTQKKTSK